MGWVGSDRTKQTRGHCSAERPTSDLSMGRVEICPWVGLTRGLGRDLSVFGALGCVGSVS